jgi:hypothetical protein
MSRKYCPHVWLGETPMTEKGMYCSVYPYEKLDCILICSPLIKAIFSTIFTDHFYIINEL